MAAVQQPDSGGGGDGSLVAAWWRWQLGGVSLAAAHFMKELIMGSLFGGCSCGIPFTDGIPCHHMVAVVKSS